MTMVKNGAVSTAQMNAFVALPLQILNLLRILNKMTKAVGYDIVSGWTIATDTQMIGYDGTSSRTAYPTRRRPGTTRMTTLVPVVLLLQILNRVTEAVGYGVVYWRTQSKAKATSRPSSIDQKQRQQEHGKGRKQEQYKTSFMVEDLIPSKAGASLSLFLCNSPLPRNTTARLLSNKQR